MSYSNGVVLAPVGMGDISNAVGNSSLDIGTLVQATDTSVKWPKYKPMRGMDDPGVWQRRGDLYGGYASRIGYKGIEQGTIGGVSATILHAFGMDIPMIDPGSSIQNQVTRIIQYTGANNWNWSKNSSFSWHWYRMLDFDGYKPSASFPLEFGPSGYSAAASTDPFLVGGRHKDAITVDDYRLFVGDLAAIFSDKLVWGAAVRVVSGGTTRYGIYYTGEDGTTTYKMSARSSSSSTYGYSSIRIPKALYSDMAGGTMTVAIIGYLPPSSGSGYDGYAILLPNNGGTDTTNPKTISIVASSTDPMANLTFNLSAGKWGLNTSTAAGKLVAFPTGMPYPTTTAYGIPTSSTIIFSVTFSNTSGSNVTLTTSSISFRLATYDMATMTQSAWKTFSASAYTWNASLSRYDSASSTIQISNGGSATYYFALSGLWSQLTPESASGYATMVMMELRYGSNTTVYTNNSAYFYATNENQGQKKFYGTVQSNYKLSGLTYSDY